jgi:L-alanine-DL-glutamate epimerase-like enolase superfamily enzyme
MGFGRTYGGGVFGSEAVRACVLHDLAPILMNEVADNIPRLWNKLEVATHYTGRSGVSFSALSTIDIALWDLLGKSLGVPIYKILGQAREEAPVYASEGWVHLSVDELVEAVRIRREEGYKAFKLRLPFNRKGCIEKMRAVRELVGSDFDIMVDVQNAWQNVAIATRNALAIREFDPFWIEEPTMVQDLDGHARVSALTGIPVAGGEHIYSKHQMREAFTKNAFNYAQPDAMRIGGISEIQKVLGMAESWFIPAVPHGACDIHIHVALSHSEDSVPYVELLTDSEAPLLTEVLYTDYEMPKDGKAFVPTKPGLGYTLNEEAIQEYTVKTV